MFTVCSSKGLSQIQQFLMMQMPGPLHPLWMNQPSEDGENCHRVLGALAGFSTITGSAFLVASFLSPLRAVDELETTYSMFASTTCFSSKLPGELAATYKAIIAMAGTSLFVIAICVLLSQLIRRTSRDCRCSYPVALLLASCCSLVAAVLAFATAPKFSLPDLGSYFLGAATLSLFAASAFAAAYLFCSGGSTALQERYRREEAMYAMSQPFTSSSMAFLSNHSPPFNYQNGQHQYPQSQPHGHYQSPQGQPHGHYQSPPGQPHSHYQSPQNHHAPVADLSNHTPSSHNHCEQPDNLDPSREDIL